MFNEREIEILHDALNMVLASNKRMQNSKPQFVQVFRQIETDVLELKNKITKNIKPTK